MSCSPTAGAAVPHRRVIGRLPRGLVLPEKKTEQPISGLLYFAMEKQKMKDLELTYGGRENRIALRFK